MLKRLDASTCPLCGEGVKGDGLSPGEFGGAPGASFRDRWVHWDCFAEWPERGAATAVYLDGIVRAARENPEMGIALCSPRLLLVAAAPADRGEGHLLLVCPDSGLIRRVGASQPWREVLEALRREAQGSHPLPRASLLGALEELRAFRDARAALEAVDWAGKRTACAFCERPLAAAPDAEEVYRTPSIPQGPPAEFRNRFAHTACYVAWPGLPRFAQDLAYAERRLSRLTPRALAYADERVQIFLERELAWRDARLRLLDTGTPLAFRGLRWERWLEDPHPFHPGLRAFERAALDALLPRLRERFPTGESLAAAVDWAGRERDHQAARQELAEACRRMEREIRCPACAGALRAVAGPALRCEGCRAERSPVELDWLPG